MMADESDVEMMAMAAEETGEAEGKTGGTDRAHPGELPERRRGRRPQRDHGNPRWDGGR